MTKRKAYDMAISNQVDSNPHGTRMDIIFEAMELYANDKLNQQSKWISVEEKTFDADKVYLLCLENGVTYVTGVFGWNSRLHKVVWKDVMGKSIEERYKFPVTHWQPLPQSPLNK